MFQLEDKVTFVSFAEMDEGPEVLQQLEALSRGLLSVAWYPFSNRGASRAAHAETSNPTSRMTGIGRRNNRSRK
jgi:hypothetical protein